MENGFLHEVFGIHAVLGFDVGSFHEHIAELSEGFGIINHLSSFFYDWTESSGSFVQMLFGVFGVFVLSGSFRSFAQWFWGDVAKI